MSATAPVSRPTPEEARALHDGVGLAAGLELEGVELRGEDRVRFLQNLITCDVAGLAVGRSMRGFLTSVRGGVLADATVENLGDRLRLVVTAGRGEAVAAHLARYQVVDRVEFEHRVAFASCALRGARAPELLRAVAAAVPEAGAHAMQDLAGVEARIRCEIRGRAPRFVLETESESLPALCDFLRAAGAPLGLVELSTAALELARIEESELLWGLDYGEENFPQETGEESAVSYTKGCYLGQEVVARIHYRGGVQRLPRRLLHLAGPLPERGAELQLERRAVGRLGSLAVDPSSGSVLALALLHRRAEPGARLQTGPGAVFEVLPSPAD